MSIIKTTSKLLSTLALASITLTSCETDSESISEITAESESEWNSKSFNLGIKNQWGSNFRGTNWNAAKANDNKTSTWCAIDNGGSLVLQLWGRKVIDGIKVVHTGGTNNNYSYVLSSYDPNTGKWTTLGTSNNNKLGSGTIQTDLTNTYADRLKITYKSSTVDYINLAEVDIWGY